MPFCNLLKSKKESTCLDFLSILYKRSKKAKNIHKINIDIIVTMKFFFFIKIIFINFIKNLLRKFSININYIYKKKTLIFLKKIYIYDCDYKLIRVGSKRDGGYLVPDILSKIKYCFSAGVGTNSSFEDNLKKFKIKSFLADGTVSYYGQHQFVRKNINTFNDHKNITFEKFVEVSLGNKKDNNLLLKMDIEGDEIKTLCNIGESLLKNTAIFIIEFHNFDIILNKFGLAMYDCAFTKLLKYFSICHIHPNNAWGVTEIFNIEIPNFIECTFLNNRYIKKKSKIKYSLPHIFDCQNKKEIEDIKLSKFFYN